MTKKAQQQNEAKQDVRFSSTLDAAIAAWETSRQAFQNEAGKEQRDGYVAATDSLGHAIAKFQSARPALAEQLGNWFLAHQELWSAGVPDGASEHRRC
jgi:hypothetical protein